MSIHLRHRPKPENTHPEPVAGWGPPVPPLELDYQPKSNRRRRRVGAAIVAGLVAAGGITAAVLSGGESSKPKSAKPAATAPPQIPPTSKAPAPSTTTPNTAPATTAPTTVPEAPKTSLSFAVLTSDLICKGLPEVPAILGGYISSQNVYTCPKPFTPDPSQHGTALAQWEGEYGPNVSIQIDNDPVTTHIFQNASALGQKTLKIDGFTCITSPTIPDSGPDCEDGHGYHAEVSGYISNDGEAIKKLPEAADEQIMSQLLKLFTQIEQNTPSS